jgi:hypothetical protein
MDRSLPAISQGHGARKRLHSEVGFDLRYQQHSAKPLPPKAGGQLLFALYRTRSGEVFDLPALPGKGCVLANLCNKLM